MSPLFRFHVVALPHTQTHRRHCPCAYTMKVLHFCQMMKSLGHTVYHYGAEGSEVDCDEHVTIISAEEQERYFGRWNPDAFYNLDWSGKTDYWYLFNGRAAAAINARKQHKDFLCIIAGSLNYPVWQQAGGGTICVEYGIGYDGTCCRYRVFESYAHMHKIRGAEAGYGADGQFYDAVIPNYFDPADYPFCPEPKDYYLYMGRLIRRKGVRIAVDVCNALEANLIVAGQGAAEHSAGRIKAEDGEVYEGRLEYVGCVTGQRKADLLGGAKAIFVPTIYIEPFGGVAVEAQMCGSPAITTDWGAFTETVEHGRTGFRCRTFDHFVYAAREAPALDRRYIHDHAVANWSLDRVRWMYQEYFQMLADLWDKGWYTRRDRTALAWLTKS